MKRILIVLIPAICLGQVFWENEVIDSVNLDMYNYRFNAMALDTNGIPCVVYFNPNWLDSIMYAWQTDSGWQKENIEFGFKYYGFSLVVDDNNIVHFSYYRRDDSLDMTYHCYGYRDTTGWQIEYVDSTAGYLSNYFLSIPSSIDLDTAGLPGIAYISLNVSDSLHYIKYAHYNGVGWDTSVVVRDTTWYHQYPLDWSPSLEFDTQNTPHIAFHRVRSDTHVDTLKIAHYDDTLSYWVVEPVMDCGVATYLISFKLDSQDHPSIAHGYGAGLAYTWLTVQHGILIMVSQALAGLKRGFVLLWTVLTNLIFYINTGEQFFPVIVTRIASGICADQLNQIPLNFMLMLT